MILPPPGRANRANVRPFGETPTRAHALALLALVFVAANLLVRIGLMAWEAASGAPSAQPARVLATGLLFDALALTWAILPFALLAWLCPDSARGRRVHAVLASALALLALVAMLLTAASEFVFWNEFAARFNFIAVDYLIYTREVLGNIRESYPVFWMLGALAALAVVIAAVLARTFWQAARGPAPAWPHRALAMVAWGLIAIALGEWVGDEWRQRIASAGDRELAGNGYHDFVRALRNNDLPYADFYRVEPDPAARRALRAEFAEARSTARFLGGQAPGSHPIEREIAPAGPAHARHLILVSVESLGADYVESFGGRPGLTPNLDRLAAEGMMFTRLYATGLRTVRGLEALTLSMPPTPGHAVPMRRSQPRLQSLGSILRDQGYDPIYVYGGYALFDNMREFFGRNGYTVIDRGAIDASEVAHENIWGVADEHLFTLGLREIDRRAAAGTRVFAHLMTTSNHRPFTFPEGRVTLPPGDGRDAAVMYTDWAIGDFVRRARERPWFRDSVFVFVADHTSHGRGRTDLPPENYRIPMVIWAPGFVTPTRVDHLASQIDVAPTVLALLNVSYTSKLFGQDILTEGRHHQRAFMSNYLTVGYLQGDVIVELAPKNRVRVSRADPTDHSPIADDLRDDLVQETVAYYQLAAEAVDPRRAAELARAGDQEADRPHQREHLVNRQPRRDPP